MSTTTVFLFTVIDFLLHIRFFYDLQ